jgi:hypothetical protein
MTALDRIIEYISDLDFDKLSEKTKQWIMNLGDK